MLFLRTFEECPVLLKASRTIIRLASALDLGSFAQVDWSSILAAAEPPPIEAELHARAARSKLEQAQDCLAHLEFARRARRDLGVACPSLDLAIEQASNEIMRFSGMLGDPIKPRRRVRVSQRNEHSAPRHEYFVFLDECGLHGPIAEDDPFPIFCLSAVIVDGENYATFDRAWRTWKSNWLGSWQVIVHEPDIRRRSSYFNFGDPARQQAAEDALAAQLADLEFTCVSAVIDKRRLAVLHPNGQVDDFLPASTYLMCIDFIFERIVHFLYHACDDAYGMVTAESRGLREDAEVSAEFLRLQLSGTQYLTDGYFRNQLRPYVQFRRKFSNSSGLQIADLIARPIAEKVLRPESTPDRWQAVASKLYDGGKGRRSSYGLKVFPASGMATVLGEEDIANEGT